ncbi:hypothetical protein H311_02048, partial [Anncaliia algerae PRA109]
MKPLILYSKRAPQVIRIMCTDLNKLIYSEMETNFDESSIYEIKELVELNECKGCIYFETTKRAAFVWLSSLEGPTIKLRLMNVKLMKFFLGNALKDCAAELIFTKDFDENELSHFRSLVVSLIKSDKPKDRVISFFYYENTIIMRIYSLKDGGLEEIGPRMDLVLEKVLEGTFNGKTLFNKSLIEE